MVVQGRAWWPKAARAGVPVLITALTALTACSSSSRLDRADAAAAEVVTTTSTPAPTRPPAPTTAASTTTTAASTTTTAASTTTAAPTTTALPTTTAAPTTTIPLPPANFEPIAALPVPLVAVGTNSGGETVRVQQRLLDLGFWLEGADGQFGLTTRQAVMAFQKYLGLASTGSVDETTAAYLSNLDRQAFATADAGTLVEVDKARQLIFMVVDGRTQWVFNTSTGNGQAYTEPDQNTPDVIQTGVSITPDGLHKVNRERPVGWWEGDLGKIYRPKYFVGGVAVHGSNSVPNYPASHGCVRVTVQAMDFIWNSGLMPMTIPVWVHGEEPV